MVATATQSPPKQELQTGPFAMPAIAFEVTMAQIAELEKKYLPLEISDVNDKAQVAAVHEGKMKCRTLRVGVEKAGKQMRDGANQFCKDVLVNQRKVTDPIERIETRLDSELAKVRAEEDRIAKEAADKKNARTRGRLDSLFAVGAIYLESQVADMPQQQFDGLLADKQREHGERQARLAEEKAESDRIAAEQKAEAERLSKEREEIDRIKAEQAAAQAKIDAEKKRIMSERVAEVRQYAWPISGEIVIDLNTTPEQYQDELARAKQMKADRDAKLEAERIADQERKEAKAKSDAEAAAKELARLEALRPDSEKLLAVVAQIEAIEVPEVSESAQAARTDVLNALRYCARDVRGTCDDLVAKK